MRFVLHGPLPREMCHFIRVQIASRESSTFWTSTISGAMLAQRRLVGHLDRLAVGHTAQVTEDLPVHVLA